MKNLTPKTHWDHTYVTRKWQPPLQLIGIGGHINRLILQKLLSTDLQGKQVLEIGAGDSAWLPYLAKTFPNSRFVGLDYSERGCALLSDRARAEGASVEVVQEDMFVDDSPIHRSFDFVFSFGVVEHFSALSRALSAKSRYAKPGGIVFTLIPNMAGMLGTLSQMWNQDIYLQHNPHDLPSLVSGHRHAGLQVMSSGYLASNNFGMLSSCFPARHGFAWHLYRLLVGASMAIWSVEGRFGELPASRMLSPYIYAIARVA